MALSKRLGSRMEDSENDEDDGLDTKMKPVGPYKVKAAKLRKKIEDEQAAIAQEWETLPLIIGVVRANARLLTALMHSHGHCRP